MDEVVFPGSLAIILTFELVDINAFDHFYVVRDIDQQVLCELRSSDSMIHARWELIDVNDSTRLTLTKKLVSMHSTWTAYNSNGDEQFSLKKNHIFPKQTNIHVSFPPALDTSVPPIGFFDYLYSEFGDFEIKGSWSAKDCAMYLTGSETKIAQMRALDNNEDFMVEVIGNVHWQLVAACFAAVLAMKRESRKRKEFTRSVPDITAKFLGGVAIGAGKAMFDLISDAI